MQYINENFFDFFKFCTDAVILSKHLIILYTKFIKNFHRNPEKRIPLKYACNMSLGLVLGENYNEISFGVI